MAIFITEGECKCVKKQCKENIGGSSLLLSVSPVQIPSLGLHAYKMLRAKYCSDAHKTSKNVNVNQPCINLPQSPKTDFPYFGMYTCAYICDINLLG